MIKTIAALALLFIHSSFAIGETTNESCAKLFLDSNEIISVKVSTEFDDKFQKAYVANDIQKYKEIIWKTHDNRKNTATLKGYLKNIDNVRSMLGRRMNGNYYIPNHYQFFDPDYKSLFVIENLAHVKEMKDPKKIKELTDSLDAWLDEYGSYHKRLNDMIDDGFEAKLQIPILEKALKDKTLEYDGRASARVPLFEIENGVQVPVVYEFSSKDVLINTIKTLKKNLKAIFPKDKSLNKKLKNSELDHIVTNQAFMRRRISFLIDRIRGISNRHRTELQNDYLKKFEKLIHNPFLNPRSDAVSRVYMKEFYNEWYSVVKRKKGKERQKQLNPGLLDEKEKERLYAAAKSNARKWLALYFVGTASAVGYAVVTPFTDNEYVRKTQAYVINFVNELMIDFHLLTPDLKECSEAYRKWTVEEVCYNKFIMAHLSYYHLKSVYDGYDLNDKDGYFYKRRAELTKLFLERRDFMDMGEFFQNNKDYLVEVANSEHLNDGFLANLAEEFPGDDKVIELALNYLLAVQGGEADSVIYRREKEFIDYTKDEGGYIFSLKLYSKDFPEMLKYFRQTGNTKVKTKELEQFMGKGELRDGLIDMLNPLNPNSPLHKNNPFYDKDLADKAKKKAQEDAKMKINLEEENHSAPDK